LGRVWGIVDSLEWNVGILGCTSALALNRTAEYLYLYTNAKYIPISHFRNLYDALVTVKYSYNGLQAPVQNTTVNPHRH